MVVLGGGPIGCEFAQVFARFGVRVTIVEAADRLLLHDEPEAAERLEQALAAEGVQVLTGVEIGSVAYEDGTFTLDLGDQQVTADKLLVAAGRRNNLSGIGLETVGVDPDADVVETDEWLRAGERLWAVGDITGKGAFTHVSMYQAAVVVRDVLGEGGPAADYRAVTRVTFTEPEVASVGLTEEQARDQGLDPGHRERGPRRPGLAGEGGGPDQGGRRPRARRARRRHGGRVGGGRGALDAGPGRARRDPARDAAHDALRLPDVPPCRGERAQGPVAGVSSLSSLPLL